MNLELSDIERSDLQAALEVHLVSLRNELVHTDDRSYRQTVRDTIDRLERIAARLGRDWAPLGLGSANPSRH